MRVRILTDGKQRFSFQRRICFIWINITLPIRYHPEQLRLEGDRCVGSLSAALEVKAKLESPSEDQYYA